MTITRYWIELRPDLGDETDCAGRPLPPTPWVILDTADGVRPVWWGSQTPEPGPFVTGWYTDDFAEAEEMFRRVATKRRTQPHEFRLCSSEEVFVHASLKSPASF
jgi:hypothetical protein